MDIVGCGVGTGRRNVQACLTIVCGHTEVLEHEEQSGGTWARVGEYTDLVSRGAKRERRERQGRGKKGELRGEGARQWDKMTDPPVSHPNHQVAPPSCPTPSSSAPFAMLCVFSKTTNPHS